MSYEEMRQGTQEKMRKEWQRNYLDEIKDKTDKHRTMKNQLMNDYWMGNAIGYDLNNILKLWIHKKCVCVCVCVCVCISKAGGEGDNRGWDGWMASLTQWTWVWVNSGSWWWTRRPGVLQSMGLQRVGHHWVAELNWYIYTHISRYVSPLGYW